MYVTYRGFAGKKDSALTQKMLYTKSNSADALLPVEIPL